MKMGSALVELIGTIPFPNLKILRQGFHQVVVLLHVAAEGREMVAGRDSTWREESLGIAHHQPDLMQLQALHHALDLFRPRVIIGSQERDCTYNAEVEWESVGAPAIRVKHIFQGLGPGLEPLEYFVIIRINHGHRARRGLENTLAHGLHCPRPNDHQI